MDEKTAFFIDGDEGKLEEEFIDRLKTLRMQVKEARDSTVISPPAGKSEAATAAPEPDMVKAMRLARIGYFTWDLVKGRLEGSPEALKIFGRTDRTFGSFDVVMSYVHPEDRQLCVIALNDAIFKDLPFNCNFRLMDNKGNVKSIHSDGEVTKNASGEPVFLFGTVQDITENLENLAVSTDESDSIHDLIFAITETIEKSVEDPMNAISESMILITPEGTIITINDVAAERLGGNRDSMTGTNWFRYMPDQVVEYRKTRIDEVIRWKMPVRFEDDCNGKVYDQTYYPIMSKTDDVNRIAIFAADVTEKRKAEQALQDSEEKLRSLITQSHDGIMIADINGIVIDFNRGYEEITGISRDKVIGKPVWDLQYKLSTKETKSEADLRSLKQLFMSSIRQIMGDNPSTHSSMFIKRPDGEVRAIETSIFHVSTNKQSLIGCITRDVTFQKKAEAAMMESLREKELLLKEIHHRVNNNLQVISSLMSLQIESTTDASTGGVLRVCQDRIKSIALIHERLYYTDNLSRINFQEYVNKLASYLNHYYKSRIDDIKLKVESDNTSLGIDTAIPCGLIVNELLTNAYKYAFPDGRKGEILVSLSRNEAGDYELIVADDGVGMPGNLDIDDTNTLGLQLVNMLTDQLDGTIIKDSARGTKYTIRFSDSRKQNYSK